MFWTKHPDEDTVKDLLKDLQDSNIDTSQLVEWKADHGQEDESSTEGSSA
jgi:hypothetical protein